MAEQFVIYLPDAYRNARCWPLVVFLHGSGDRGNDPSILLKHAPPIRQNLPAIVAAPQCREQFDWDPAAIAGLIQNLTSRYHVTLDRIYLVGFSMGGSGIWRTAAARPELIAAIVPISGSGEPNNAKALSATPIWAFHGAKDKIVPVAESQRMIDAVTNAGGQARLTIIPNAGHAICESVCGRAELWQWLFQQRRSK